MRSYFERRNIPYSRWLGDGMAVSQLVILGIVLAVRAYQFITVWLGQCAMTMAPLPGQAAGLNVLSAHDALSDTKMMYSLVQRMAE